MAKPTKQQEAKIKKLEKEIKESDSLWDRIKKMPKEDKLSLKKLKELVKTHKVTKKLSVSKKIKGKAKKLFRNLEPPEELGKPKKTRKNPKH